MKQQKNQVLMIQQKKLLLAIRIYLLINYFYLLNKYVI